MANQFKYVVFLAFTSFVVSLFTLSLLQPIITPSTVNIFGLMYFSVFFSGFIFGGALWIKNHRYDLMVIPVTILGIILICSVIELMSHLTPFYTVCLSILLITTFTATCLLHWSVSPTFDKAILS